MEYLVLTILLLSLLWIAYKIFQAWPEIVTTARLMADTMDDMTILEAAKYSLVGRIERDTNDD